MVFCNRALAFHNEYSGLIYDHISSSITHLLIYLTGAPTGRDLSPVSKTAELVGSAEPSGAVF